jgi:hypothetical protein
MHLMVYNVLMYFMQYYINVFHILCLFFLITHTTCLSALFSAYDFLSNFNCDFTGVQPLPYVLRNKMHL